MSAGAGWDSAFKLRTSIRLPKQMMEEERRFLLICHVFSNSHFDVFSDLTSGLCFPSWWRFSRLVLPLWLSLSNFLGLLLPHAVRLPDTWQFSLVVLSQGGSWSSSNQFSWLVV